jgi:hypothetical protein
MSRVANEIEFSHISFFNSGRPPSPEKNYLISCVVSLFIYRGNQDLAFLEKDCMGMLLVFQR